MVRKVILALNCSTDHPPQRVIVGLSMGVGLADHLAVAVVADDLVKVAIEIGFV